jgi:hypothetical protein
MIRSKLAVWGNILLVTWCSLLLTTQEHLRYIIEEIQRPPLESRRLFSHAYAASSSSQGFDRFQDDRENSLRFIVFQGDLTGQGAGNILNGLLAAHLLADEFGRILCVSPAYEDFVLAFSSVHPDVVKNCPKVIQAWEAQMDATNPLKRGRRRSYKYPPKDFLLHFTNFGGHPVNECEVKDQLASDTPVWYLRTNTYPRWPTTYNAIPENYFDRYYQPNNKLLGLLPKSFPSTVVHLRKEDGQQDVRKGLDNQTLTALADYLEGQSPYLVTNHVEYYQYFNERQWAHPAWENVIHSAMLNANNNRGRDFRVRQKLQLWADWYILLKAKTVYHTFSDFSASAVHWMEPTSQSARVIRGYNATTQSLELDVEWWRQEGDLPMLPLGERPPEQLLNCYSMDKQ